MNYQEKQTPDFGTQKKPLHFFFVADCSGSMANDGKIGALNEAIHAAIPEMRHAADNEVGVQVYVRAIRFGEGAFWHVQDPVPLQNFSWTDITNLTPATDMGEALRLVNSVLTEDLLGKRNLPPVVVLITDGYATDDIDISIQEFLENPWGKKAVKIAVGIGADYHQEQLLEFVEQNQEFMIDARRPENLVSLIKWASTVAIKTSSEAKPMDQSDDFISEQPTWVPSEEQVEEILNEDEEEPF